MIKAADVVWIIAPESGNELLNLTRLATAAGNLYTGSDDYTVDITTSKKRTVELLRNANIDCVLSERYPNIPSATSGWVVKRDDGVGGEDTYYFNDRSLLEIYLDTVDHPTDWVIQPYLAGDVLSLSLLCYGGCPPLVLACNKQIINRSAQRFCLQAIHINKYHNKRNEFQSLANRIAALLPGLTGFVGVDLIYLANKIYVLEINPRFTTAYAALSPSLGINIAELILKTVKNKALPDDQPLSHARPIYLPL